MLIKSFYFLPKNRRSATIPSILKMETLGAKLQRLSFSSGDPELYRKEIDSIVAAITEEAESQAKNGSFTASYVFPTSKLIKHPNQFIIDQFKQQGVELTLCDNLYCGDGCYDCGHHDGYCIDWSPLPATCVQKKIK